MTRFAIPLAVGICALCWASPGERLGAQERGPIGIPMFRVAPKAIAAEVDGAAMSIVYGPPSMQGRTIFGGEVPYGSAWCVGVDSCARFATDRPLRFDDLVLDAGEYLDGIVPTQDIWTLIFNSNSRGARQQRYNPRLNVGTTVPSDERPFRRRSSS